MVSSLLDTFGVPAAAFKTGIQADRGGKPDRKQYVHEYVSCQLSNLLCTGLKTSQHATSYCTMASLALYPASRTNSTTYPAKD
jgi:hypothetical protein